MAKMHTKGRGKSKSRKPDVKIGEMPEGMTLSKEEIVDTISRYAKQGVHQAHIGQNLKDKHKVLYIKQIFGKRLGQILQEKGFKTELPQDMLDLIKRAVVIRKHLKANHKDVHNRTRLNRVESKIWRLSKYYKSTGKIPNSWKYDPEKAVLLVKGM